MNSKLKKCFNNLGNLPEENTLEILSYPIMNIPQGTSLTDHFIICRSNENFKFFNRRCDHNAGI